MLQRLDWLLRLRLSAIFFATVCLLLAERFLGYSLPHLWASLLLAILLLPNLVMYIRQRRGVGISGNALGMVFLLDTVALTLALAWSGGPLNPFSVFYLLHTTLSALVLGAAWTWVLAGMSSLCYLSLFLFFDAPSHHHHGHGGHFDLHLYGMLLAFVLAAGIISFLLSLMSRRLREQEQTLRQQEAREEQLAMLAELSAGAAHELGSPLGSIAIAAGELQELLAGQTGECAVALAVISEEVLRCRQILGGLSAKAGVPRGEAPEAVSLGALVEEISKELTVIQNEQLRLLIPDKELEIVVPRQGLVVSLLSLLRNAFEATLPNTPIELQVGIEPGAVWFSVSDQGEGIDAEGVRRIGEPFFSNKPHGTGMGLGLFLVKLFSSRWGGSMDVSSRLTEGTSVVVRLPQPLLLGVR